MDFDATEMTRLTGMSEAYRAELGRFYGRLPEGLRLEAHGRMTILIRDNRKNELYQGLPFEIYCYLMFLKSVQSLKRNEHALSRKQRLTLESTAELTKIRIERSKGVTKRSIGKLRENVEAILPLVRQLREKEHLSWRKIEEYLRRYHRTDVSFGYLRQCYKAVEDADK